MKNKICLITGANAGIGKTTALGLAKLGARVVMVSRNKERGEKALKEIASESGNENIDLLTADLASIKLRITSSITPLSFLNFRFFNVGTHNGRLNTLRIRLLTASIK